MNIKELIERSHKNATEKGFHEGRKNIGEKLMLIVSELGEALEAHRKCEFADWELNKYLIDMTSGYTPEEAFLKSIKDTFEDEIADVFIRLADLCGYLNIDIEKHIEAKMKYNENRPRLHGKEY